MSDNETDDTYRCEACGVGLTREGYVAVGPTTPAAKQLEIEDRSRDHLVVCDDCFEKASRSIDTDTDRGDDDA